MQLLLVFGIIATAVCTVQGRPCMDQDGPCMDQDEPFTVEVYTEDEYKIGDDVICSVKITNNHDNDYHLLKRYTPLEGLLTSIFQVTANEEILHYDGFFVGRLAPTREEYIEIAAKSSLHADVDLSSAYAFATQGPHTVKLQTTLQYYEDDMMVTSRQEVSSNIQEFLLADSDSLPKPTVAEEARRNDKLQQQQSQASYNALGARSPNAYGFSNWGRGVARNAYFGAYNLLPGCLNRISYSNSYYQKYFGSQVSTSVVNNVISKVKTCMEKYTYTLQYSTVSFCAKSGSYYGYTSKGSYTIYLCQYFLTMTSLRRNTGILHEMTHAAAYTGDYGNYGDFNSQQLAKTNPSQAQNNADNYRFFCS